MADDDYRRLGSACHCGETVKLWAGRGRKPSLCDDHAQRSRPALEPQECPACRGFFTPSREGQKACSALCRLRLRRGNKPRQLREYFCVICECAFESIVESAMYCSRKCKTLGWRAKNPTRTDYKQTLCAYWTGYCATCNVPMGGRRSRLTCDVCQRQVALSAARVAAYATNLTKHKARGLVVRCTECELEFCPLYGVKARTACSCCDPGLHKERKRAAKAKRHKRIKSADSETVWPNKVFKRDQWKCQLCGIETPKTLRGTHEHNAPELDHVLPLARGGSHSYANTQCLCRSCNGWKAARTMEEVMQALAA